MFDRYTTGPGCGAAWKSQAQSYGARRSAVKAIALSYSVRHCTAPLILLWLERLCPVTACETTEETEENDARSHVQSHRPRGLIAGRCRSGDSERRRARQPHPAWSGLVPGYRDPRAYRER